MDIIEDSTLSACVGYILFSEDDFYGKQDVKSSSDKDQKFISSSGASNLLDSKETGK